MFIFFTRIIFFRNFLFLYVLQCCWQRNIHIHPFHTQFSLRLVLNIFTDNYHQHAVESRSINRRLTIVCRDVRHICDRQKATHSVCAVRYVIASHELAIYAALIFNLYVAHLGANSEQQP